MYFGVIYIKNEIVIFRMWVKFLLIVGVLILLFSSGESYNYYEDLKNV